MTLQIGASASRTRTLTADDIALYAQVSGDDNPVHLDEAAAAESIFGQRVAHGMLTASGISAILGTDLPGPGTIYLSQQLQFKAPVFIGDTITTSVECINYREDKRIATFRTTVTNQKDETVLEGEAVVIAPEA